MQVLVTGLILLPLVYIGLPPAAAATYETTTKVHTQDRWIGRHGAKLDKLDSGWLMHIFLSVLIFLGLGLDLHIFRLRSSDGILGDSAPFEDL